MNHRRTIALVLPEMTASQADALIRLLDHVSSQLWDAFEPSLTQRVRDGALDSPDTNTADDDSPL